jgi:hypothetical protein
LLRTENIKYSISALIFSLLSFCAQYTFAQITSGDDDEPPPLAEQQLENLTESMDDEETEDDSYLQDLAQFLKEPVNLNHADKGQLEELKIISAIQIDNLIAYRKLLGNLISIYELQAVPGWDINFIRRIRPFITVSNKIEIFNSIGSRLKSGQHTILLRSSRVLEKSKGYLLDRSAASNYYPGSPVKILLRYKYRFKNYLQFGFTAEKDAGEQFFRGAQKDGFDFYSAHFYARNLGIIKSLVIGDFSINLGQGLTQWQGLAFGKGSEIINIKRQSDVLRPYNSAGEIAFNRGVGITLNKNNWEATAFAGYRKLDANFVNDTLNYNDYVSSLQTSGNHRTNSEVTDMGRQGQLSVGGNIGYSNDKFHVGLNGVHYDFEYPITKHGYLYNAFALSGKTAGNYSVDYSYTFKNMHFFGEAAIDNGFDKAFVNGLLISTDAHVDMSILYRKISRGYQSLYTNAFTENTFPANESGLFAGISISPLSSFKINAYADFFSFPWLKYRVDAPSTGQEYMIQFTYHPNKQVEIYTRYRTKTKAINYNPGNLALNPVELKPKQGLRTQFSIKINNSFTFRSKVELVWFDKRGPNPQNGFLVFSEVKYKPLQSPFSANLRLQYFETDGYDSRIYAFENDVQYSYSIPVFFDKGYRYYLNIKFDLTNRLSVWGRFSQTYYPEKNSIGSGLDLINSHSKSEIKLQGILTF